MHHEAQMLLVKKKRKVCLPKNLHIAHTWQIIGPTIAQEIGVPDYTPVPNFFDVNAYKLGHIFVPITTQIKCFRAVSVLKILGAIRDFVVKAETNVKWLDKEFHSERSSGDQTNFRISLERGRNELSFTGYDYYFLNKAQDMPIVSNVTINRAAHEDLSHIKWFGLITNVVTTKNFELHAVKGLRTRTLYIGNNANTILFNYEICKINKNGAVVNSEVKKIRCKWLPIGERESDSLPLTKFQSAITK